MTYRLCKRLIELKRTTDLQQKLDVFFSLGRLNEAEYRELTDMINPKSKMPEVK